MSGIGREGDSLFLKARPSRLLAYPLLAGQKMVFLASNGWMRMDELERVKLFWLGASPGGMLIEAPQNTRTQGGHKVLGPKKFQPAEG